MYVGVGWLVIGWVWGEAVVEVVVFFAGAWEMKFEPMVRHGPVPGPL